MRVNNLEIDNKIKRASKINVESNIDIENSTKMENSIKKESSIKAQNTVKKECKINTEDNIKIKSTVKKESKIKRTENRLYAYKDIDILNQLTDIKIKKLKDDVSIKAMTYEEKFATNRFNSNVENEVIRREEFVETRIEELRKEKESRLNEKALIDKVLELLEVEEKRLVGLRYFSKPTRSWTSIAQELNQSVDNCIKVRRRVIGKLDGFLF